MAAKKPFTESEQKLLKRNPYTYQVTVQEIHFTAEFKQAFWDLYRSGTSPVLVMRQLGYDTDLLGNQNFTARLICGGIFRFLCSCLRYWRCFYICCRFFTFILWHWDIFCFFSTAGRYSKQHTERQKSYNPFFHQEASFSFSCLSF